MNLVNYKKSFILLLVTLLCQMINLLRDILMAKNFGTSAINDVYLLSQSFLSVAVSMISSPLAVAFVPVVTSYYIKKTVDERNMFISNIYINITILGVILCTIIAILINDIVGVLAPGFSLQERNMLVEVLLIQLPIIIINSLKGVNRGNFQILQCFSISEVTNILPYICLCIYLLVSVDKNIYEIAVVLSVATLISVIPEIVLLLKKGYRFKFFFELSKDIKTMIVLMGGAAVAAGVREINVLFDKAIGSLLPIGSITMLSYSSKLTVVIIGIVTSAISLIGFSNIARLKYQGSQHDVCNVIYDSCNLINFIVVPMMFYLFVFSDDIIALLYLDGAFNLNDVHITANLMKLYAIGLIGYGFQDVYTRTLYAYKITRSTIKISIYMLVSNIMFNFLLYRFIGVYGVAIATSLSILIIIPILEKDVKKYIPEFNSRIIYRELFNVVMLSCLSSIVCILIRFIFDNNYTFFFVFKTIIYTLIYVCACYVTKNTIFNNILLTFRHKISIIN